MIFIINTVKTEPTDDVPQPDNKKAIKPDKTPYVNLPRKLKGVIPYSWIKKNAVKRVPLVINAVNMSPCAKEPPNGTSTKRRTRIA